MPEDNIGLVNEDELNFDQSFLQLSVKKKNICEEFFSISL